MGGASDAGGADPFREDRAFTAQELGRLPQLTSELLFNEKAWLVEFGVSTSYDGRTFCLDVSRGWF